MPHLVSTNPTQLLLNSGLLCRFSGPELVCTTCYTYYVLRICICICSRQWQQQHQRQQNCSWWPSDTAQTLSRIRGGADDAVERAHSTAKVKGTAINNNYNKYNNNNNYSNNYNHKVRNIARSVEVATGRGAEIKSIEARKLHATRQKKQNGKASLETRGATPLPPYPIPPHFALLNWVSNKQTKWKYYTK